MSVSGGWSGLPTKPRKPLNFRPRRSNAGRNENLAMSPPIARGEGRGPSLWRFAPGVGMVPSRAGRDPIDAGRLFLDLAVLRCLRERLQQALADVRLRERVDVAALQREGLDHRPVERLPLLAEDRECCLAELHPAAAQVRAAARDGAMISSANT